MTEKGERTTKVFAKAGLDIVTSTMYRHQQWFGLDVQCSALVHNFNNIFSNGHLFLAGQSMNSLPSQILERCVQSFGPAINKARHACAGDRFCGQTSFIFFQNILKGNFLLPTHRLKPGFGNRRAVIFFIPAAFCDWVRSAGKSMKRGNTAHNIGFTQVRLDERTIGNGAHPRLQIPAERNPDRLLFKQSTFNYTFGIGPGWT